MSRGDRDGDDKDAEIESTLAIEDDACTVYEINATSNISPQFHNRFNGSPGLWWQLEISIRKLIDKGGNFHLFAGTVFDQNKPINLIGDRKKDTASWNVALPHGFF